ncbi:hypothetical protein JCM9152_657 [Halalkalibacter hemicellulosilyticusJCM 9152]|uniref:Lipoprotein n=1 Tax=Halalkalibacter hemicellulosilyticusJCM 9152 TaxID=1236971 RepID=W4QBG6_9BACI|nr:hypothetical protein JCM9152_657 [Halalkalibacter hemicellulosilyticusJCM 9152]
MKYGKWSAILSIICGVGLLSCYVFASDTPQGLEYIILIVLFYGSLFLGILSLIYTVIAYYKKEKGFVKNVAPIVISFILLVYLLVFILMVIGLTSGP